VKRWDAPRNPRVLAWLLIAALLVGGALGGLVNLRDDLRGPIDNWAITLPVFGVVLAVLAAFGSALVLVLRALRHASLGYALDRNAIYVLHRNSRYIIPLNAVTGMWPADRETPPTTLSVIAFGAGNAATRVIVDTQHARYCLAVRDRDPFVRELEDRLRLGVVQPQPEGLVRRRPTLAAFLTAPSVQALTLLTLLLNLVIWGLLASRYTALPETVPVRFDPIGGTAGTRARSYTLLLPAAATIMALFNGLLALANHRRTRLGSELLLLGALVTQIVLLVAVGFLVRVAQS
jgi:hypothetical protein